MKTKIINFFKTDRTYRGGVSLIHQFSIKLGLKKQLNIHPESDYLKGCVFEELREIAGISNSELNTYLAMPLPKATPLKRSQDLPANLNPEVDQITGQNQTSDQDATVVSAAEAGDQDATVVGAAEAGDQDATVVSAAEAGDQDQVETPIVATVETPVVSKPVVEKKQQPAVANDKKKAAPVKKQSRKK